MDERAKDAILFWAIVCALGWTMLFLALVGCRTLSRGDDSGDMSSCIYNCQNVRLLPQLQEAAQQRQERFK